MITISCYENWAIETYGQWLFSAFNLQSIENEEEQSKISVYAKSGLCDDAIKLFETMKLSGSSPIISDDAKSGWVDLFMYLPLLLSLAFYQTPSTLSLSLSKFSISDLQMDLTNSDMPCKIRKRRFPTTSSSSFPHNSLAQLFAEKIDSPGNEKCGDKLDRSYCEEDEAVAIIVPKSGSDNRLNDVFQKSSTNVDRSRNNRISPNRVSVPEVINPSCRQSRSFMEKDHSFGGMPLTYIAQPFEENVTKDRGQVMLKSTHGLDEIKHSLTVSKEILKLLVRVWTNDTDQDHRHPTSLSLASTLNHELNKARSHVNKLIQEQRSNQTMTHESEEHDKIRVAVKTISRELETERKLRRQAERMNKKLGRELANTKLSLAKAVKKAESEKQATEVLDELCQKMARSVEEHRVELEELRKESERVREEIDEEREMLRVADMLREERVQMKLIDAKYEYEDKHKQVDILARDLEALLEAEDGIYHITPTVLSWYQSTSYNKGETKSRSDIGKVVNDENTLGVEARGFSWYENKGEVVNDEMPNTQNEVVGRNSDCIEWDFRLEMKRQSVDLNGCLEERALEISGSSTMKEYEDEMERYKMIKDLRDRIVSGSDLTRLTLDFGSYM
ncbi:hypothetical protein QVD17_28036 [Tagetes erecta]|uniref:Uncharacterized protein n=1 Tax=Tagetes erecta TaxID=13708 RepID=A0AAD8KD26_TARER|nr:hypothetical protein QVD17_28036 [Tagetes erecta]